MVKALSVRLGHKLGQSLQANNDEIEVYSYAFELLLCGLIEILFLFFFALLFGIFTNTLLVFLAFAGFRIPGGGAHMQTYMHCVIKGLVLQLTFAYLSTFYMPIEVIIALFGLMILLALTTIIFWVPAGTEKKPIDKPADRRKQKMETFIFLSIWLTVTVFLLFWGYHQYALAFIFGAFIALFNITPAGYLAAARLDKILYILEGR